MVYSGKPSTACRTCRQRRIKVSPLLMHCSNTWLRFGQCDETRPACNQCIRARKTCLGYPDLNDLLFQNETSRIVRRTQKANAKQSIKSEGATPKSETSTPESSPESDVLSLTANPAESVTTAAACFFLEGLLVEPLSAGRNVGHLEFLPKFYLHAMPSSTIARTTNAMCLAAFSTFGKEDSAFTQQAFKAYGEAVVSLHTDLKDPDMLSKNETLMSMLVMLVVEALLAHSHAPTKQWNMHVLGAVRLLMTRGEAVFQDTMASRLFNVVRLFVSEGVRARGESLPPFFAKPTPLPETPESLLSQYLTPIPQIRRPILLCLKSMDMENIALLSNFVQDCQQTDGRVLMWSRALPESYAYQIMPNREGDEPDFPFAQPRHQYKDSHNHRLWNAYRYTRICMNVLALRCLEQLSILSGTDLTDAISLCQHNIQSMANEICQSLPPQLLSGRPIPRLKTMSQVQRAVSAYYMLWPLYAAQSLITIPQIQRQWIRDRLAEISDYFHLRNARILVEAAEADPGRPMFMAEWPDDAIENVWETTFMYGSGSV